MRLVYRTTSGQVLLWTCFVLLETVYFSACDCGGAAECHLNSDCPRGQYCHNGRCRQDCREDRDCGPGGKCDTENGRCTSIGDADAWPDAGACSTDQDCNPPYTVCDSGHCMAGCVIEGAGCPQGQTCDRRTGRCTPFGDNDLVPCTTDADCNPPENVCDETLGYCVPGCLTTGCENGFSCDQVTGRCNLPGDDYEPEELAVSYIHPDSGPASGGNQVWVTGAAFTTGTAVRFGGKDAHIISRNLPGALSVAVPAGPAGETVDVEVIDNNTTKSVKLKKAYRYLKPAAPAEFSFTVLTIDLDEAGDSLRAKDINMDGFPDLVAGCPDSGAVAVSLGGKDFNFSEPVKWALDYSSPVALDLADLNGDGYVDLVCANGLYTRYLTQALGDGAGSFAYVRELSTGIGPVDVVVEDLNRDGLVDVASADHRSTGFSIFASTAGGLTDAMPGFGAADTTRIIAFGARGKMRVATVGSSKAMIAVAGPAAPLAEIELPELPGDIVAADIDADGLMDFVVTYPTRSSIQVVSGLGNRLWAPTREYLAGPKPKYLAAGDMDGDGDVDLVVAGEGIYLLEGNGKGKFQPAFSLALDAPPGEPVISDFNKDGLPDIAFRKGGSIVVLENKSETGHESDAPLLLDIVPSTGPMQGGNKVNIFGAGLPNGMEVSFGDRSAADLELRTSGWSVVTAPPAPGSEPGLVDVWIKAPGGTDRSVLRGAYDYLSNKDRIVLGHATTTVDGGLNELCAVDLDMDGLPEIVAAESAKPSLKVFGIVGTSPVAEIDLPGQVRFLDTGDVNDDGCGDVAAALFMGGKIQPSVMISDCEGGLIDPVILDVPGVSMSAGMVLADLNADRKADIAGIGGNSIITLIGAGNGFFGMPNISGLVEFAQDLEWGYLGFDGIPDLVVADSTLAGDSGKLVFAMGSGTGKLNLGSLVTLDSPARKVTLGSSPGGELPVPFVSTDEKVLAVTGNYFKADDITVVQVADSKACDMASADFNGDSLPDLALLVEKENVVSAVIYLNRPGEDTWTEAARTEIQDSDCEKNEVLATDLDADGAVDLVISSNQGLEILLQRHD